MPTTADLRKRHGIHYTPPELARFLARRAVRAVRGASSPVRVLDPACGHGELLVAAHKELRRRGHRDIELVGWDTDASALAATRARLGAIRCPSTVVLRDFVLEHGEERAVDLVITNPPYVRTQVLGAEAAALARRFGLRGRVDLAHAFVAAAHAVLVDGGTLALLCSNRFLTTRAGANVRELLRRRFAVEEVVDLGDSKPFGAAVLPAVVVAVRSRARGPAPAARFVSVYTDPQCARPVSGPPGAVDIYDAAEGVEDRCVVRDGTHFAVTVGRLRMCDVGDRTWSLSSGRNDRWTAVVERRTWRTFGELGRIRVGIKTTADRVFVRDDWHRMADGIRPEDELLLPLLTHRDVAAWRAPTAPATRVLYPYDLSGHARRVLDLAEHPAARAYLDRHRDQLEARKYLIEAGRRWYEIWVPQRPAAWRRPKVVFPDISVEPRFSVDTSGAVVNGDCYWMAFDEFEHEDLAYLLVAVANSALAVRFYDILCGNRLYAGRRRWMTQYVSRLPVPDPDTPVARRIVECARELCVSAGRAPAELVGTVGRLVDEAFSVGRP